MKQQLIKLFMAFGSACLMGTGLQAQTNTVGADIPFAFHVGTTTHDAGHYRIQKASLGAYATVINTDSRKRMFVSYRPGGHASSKGPRLVFHRYGKQYFLAEIWMDKDNGAKVPFTAQEKEVRRLTMSPEQATTSVALQASLR